MTREEAAVYIAETFEWVMREYENHRAEHPQNNGKCGLKSK